MGGLNRPQGFLHLGRVLRLLRIESFGLFFFEGGLRVARRPCDCRARRCRRVHDCSACRYRHPRCPFGNPDRRLAGSLSGPLNLLQQVEAFVEYAHGRFFLVGE